MMEMKQSHVVVIILKVTDLKNAVFARVWYAIYVMNGKNKLYGGRYHADKYSNG